MPNFLRTKFTIPIFVPDFPLPSRAQSAWCNAQSVQCVAECQGQRVVCGWAQYTIVWRMAFKGPRVFSAVSWHWESSADRPRFGRRYINLIRKGAEQMGIEPSYCKWLQQIPSVPDNSRDADYYDTGSGRRPSRDRPSSQGARPGGSPARERRRPDSAKRPRSPARQTPQSAGGDAPRGAESGGPGRGRQGRTRGAADRFTVFSEPGSGPAGLCVRGNGLYVSDHKSDSVKLVSLEGPEGGAAVVAGGNGKGRRPEQLSRPWRLFVDAHGGVFVVDRNNARVQRWGPDGRVVTVAGGHGAGPELWQLDQPVDVHVLAGGEVYVSDRGNHRVVLWPPGASQGRVVAGGRGFGRGLDQLACPGGLQVTGTGVIYVADEANNRVMRWRPDGDAGQVVAGGQGAGGGTAQLYHPLGLWVSDEEDCLVVADSLGYRVQRFVLSAQTPDSSAEPQVPVAETIAGGEPGSAAGQLGQPMTVQVADDGALFVADSDNARVQRYDASEQARAVERTRRENRPLTERNELRTGHCTEYNARSGYGFVRDDGGLKYFAHHSDIIDPTVRSGYPTLSKGDPVAFEARRDAKWKWRGTNIVKTAP